MKSFYGVREPRFKNEEQYNKDKSQVVLETIKPICEAFGIEDYDYIMDKYRERLVIEGQAIGCMSNSIGATVNELIGYIFVKYVVPNKSLGAFEKQTVNAIKRYWIKE